MFFQPSDSQKIIDFLKLKQAEAIAMHAQGFKVEAAIQLFDSITDSATKLTLAGSSFKQQILGNFDSGVKEAQNQSIELLSRWLPDLSETERNNIAVINPRSDSIYATVYMLKRLKFGVRPDINDYDENLMPIDPARCTIS